MLLKEQNFENTMGKGRKCFRIETVKKEISDLLFNDPEIETLFLLFFSFLLSQKTKFNIILPFPKQQILDSSKLKKFADNNVKFHENGLKFFSPVFLKDL